MPSETDRARRAGQRLHPASLIFSVSSAAWKLLLPGILVLLFAARGGNAEFWLMLLFFPAVLAALAKYVSFRYRLGDGELVIREGILTRNERHIPYARIQNIDLIQNPFHRLLRVAQVRIETAGGEEPEANMQVLSLPAVEQMRARVFRDRRQAIDAGGEPPSVTTVEPAAEAPQTLLRLAPRDLVLYGIISNRGMVIVLAVVGLLWQVVWRQGWDETLPEWAPGWLRDLPQMISGKDVQSFLGPSERVAGFSFGNVLVIIGALVAALLLLRLLSIVWAFVKLHGFTLTRAGDDLRTSLGLFTRLSATIPRHRVQILTVRETLLHRWFRRVEVKVKTAGGGKQNAELEVSRQMLAPLLPASETERLLREMGQELELESLDWRRVDPRAWGRIFRKLLILELLLTAVAWFLWGAWVWVALAIILPGSTLLAWLGYKRMAYALTSDTVIYRSGWWVRHLSVARHGKIQALNMSQTPLDRWHRMATVRVDTAGAGRTGHRISIPYLHIDVARGVFDRLALETGRTEFRW